MPKESAALAAIHAASSALSALGTGLTADTARQAVPHLRTLLSTPAVAITADDKLVAWEGVGLDSHAAMVSDHAAHAFAVQEPLVLATVCARRKCPIRKVVATPVTVENRAVGALCVYARSTPPGLVRATWEVAGWISDRLALERSRNRLVDAEIRGLRPQVSPHFLFNSLAAIISITRTDPEHAQDLLQEFSDVVRYSFRRHAVLATLEDELRAIDPYLALARARFSDRLRVTVDVAPEALSVAVPFLCLQPLVDNAIHHGMERKPGPGRIGVVAAPVGTEVNISVEDDGVGMDPERVRRLHTGEYTPDDDAGLANLDRRLRRAFGDGYGLVVRTAEGVGTTVSMRVPRRRPDDGS
jgi:two-component system LytT family sensor kinase